jgi:DNA oxidative demethylase
MADCKKHDKPTLSASEVMAEGAVLFRGLALPHDDELLRALDDVTAAAPFRHMVTPGGFAMSVAMTNCGAAGWVTDRSGYRYDQNDPESGMPWPETPIQSFPLRSACPRPSNSAD